MRTAMTLLMGIAVNLAGAQWTTIPSGTLDELGAVLVDDTDNFIVGGANGLLLRTSDGGGSWSTQMLSALGDVGDIMRVDDDLLLACGGDGMVMRSMDNGSSWTPVSTPAPNDLYALTRIGTTVWASGRDGAIVQSNDLGLTWTAQTSGTSERLHGIHALNAQDLVALGRNGVLLRSSNGGTSWTLSTLAGGDDLRGLLFLDDAQQTGLISGPGGMILRSTDLGATWSSISIGALNAVEGLASDDPDVVYAVGADALVLRSTDQGLTWAPMTTTAFSELSRVSVGMGAAVAVGANGTIIKYEDEAPIGIATVPGIPSVTMYPNPSAGHVQFTLPNAPSRTVLQVELIHVDGRSASSTRWDAGIGPLAFNDLASGQYMVRVMDQGALIAVGRLMIIAN